MLLSIDQIAFETIHMDRTIALLGGEWIRDTVKAVNVLRNRNLLRQEFVVHLGFNYNICPDKEFELIQLGDGSSCQLRGWPHLSHVGMHVPDGQLWTLVNQIHDRNLGTLEQVTHTVLHTSARRFYRYAFLDCSAKLGYYLKLIERLPADASVGVDDTEAELVAHVIQREAK